MEVTFDQGFGQARSVADLLLVAGQGGPLLVAVERLGGGLRSYGVNSLIQQDYRPYLGGDLGTGAAIELAEGTGRILLAGNRSDAVNSYLVDTAGQIGPVASWSLPGGAPEARLLALASSTDQAGRRLVYGSVDGQLRGWQITDSGGITAVARTGAATAYDQGQITALDVIPSGGTQILLAADAMIGGLRSYQISPDTGALAPAQELGAQQGLGIAAPTAVLGLGGYGQSWAILAAAGTSSLSVVQVASDGGLTLVDHLSDSLASRFGQVSALESFTVDGHVFVLAAGGDGGMELLRLLPTGHLVQAAQILHAEGHGLHNVTAIESYVSAQEVAIFVASEAGVNADGEGIAKYVLARGALGQVLEASQASLTGTAGDDLLLGGTRAVTLSGGGGDDMLVARSAGDRLEGGAGADIFVVLSDLVNAGQARVVIAGFEPGRDQLDLSLLAGLRSLSQLMVEQRHNGIDLHWQGQTIRVESHDGSRLDLSDLWPQGWRGAHHLPLGETLPASEDEDIGGGDTVPGETPDDPTSPPSGDAPILGGVGDDTLTGSAEGDVIEGGEGADLLVGEDGPDTLSGGAGDDRLEGGTGGDHLEGGPGADVLLGEEGDDTLSGGAGIDSLWGGAGDDDLLGAQGDDFLWGGAGADQLNGARGHDQIWGEQGNDMLWGLPGDDTLSGGVGADSLWGGTGADQLLGGTGEDRLSGKTGDDHLWGHAGADLVLGHRGRDFLYGGAGDDRLNGHGGQDNLWGGSGDDLLQGGSQADHLRGGRGQDRLWGQRGHDLLEGQQGNDTLRGHEGNDTLRGGLGADLFIFDRDNGRDRVMDFTSGQDVLHLRFLGEDGVQSFDELEVRQRGEDLVLEIGTGLVILVGAAQNGVDAGDFLF